MRPVIAESVEHVDWLYRSSLTGIPESSILCKMCLDTEKWGLYLSFNNQPLLRPDVLAKIPFLSNPENFPTLSNGFGFFLFDTKDELDAAVGSIGSPDDSGVDFQRFQHLNDGPPRYLGWLVTCSPEGREWDEKDI